MHILIVLDTKFPVVNYGGTERVMWYLGEELSKRNHKVSFLCQQGSVCPFAYCIAFDPSKHINEQIPEDVDLIHFNNGTAGYSGKKPYIVTYHGNYNTLIDKNAVFVSRNHAERNGSNSYVYNGLNWDDYGTVDFNNERRYFHFLGKAAWRVKNVTGAIDIVKNLPGEQLYVLGGYRLNLKMGFRFTLTPKVHFLGMIGGEKKLHYLKASKGLIFPVRWHEPFGLAITESMYCGAPVFGTPYGSLPELITWETGFLTSSKEEMIMHILNDYHYSPKICHEYARDLFNSQIMARCYLEKYEIVLNGGVLNSKQPIANPADTRNRAQYPFD